MPAVPMRSVPSILVRTQMTEVERVARLSLEVDRIQNLVSILSSKTPDLIEAEWKEVLAMVESDKAKHSVSVARCFPGKNRVLDVLPYDQTRVVLREAKDDYINASTISNPGDLCCANIVTQAPASRRKGEFWSMVWQEGVETLVCLSLDQELGEAAYLPKDETSIAVDGFTITLLDSKSHPNFMERVINITNTTNHQTRALVQLQMVGLAGPDLPLSPACLLDMAVATLELKRQQSVASS